MAITLLRPLKAYPELNYFINGLEKELNRLDRQNIKFLRRDFTKADANAGALSIGAIPENAVILKPLTGVEIHEVFNAATTNTFAMGTAASTTLYGSGLSLTGLGFVPVTANVSYLPSTTAMTEIKGTVTTTGAAATTGKGVFVVAYLVPQEG